jgi:hypothetical protein
MGFRTVLLWIFIVVSALGLGAMGIYGALLDYQYEKAIGAHLNMAVDLISPEQILEELNATKAAMISEGLTPEMSSAWIFKQPDNMMKFQYQHLDSIIARTQAVVEWKNKAYGNTTNNMPIETTDIYQQKIDNLRNYITQEVRSDWIAKGAWMLNKHNAFFVMTRILVPLLVFLLIISTIGLMILGSMDSSF